MPEAEKTDKPESSGNSQQAASGLKRRWLLNAGLLGLIAHSPGSWCNAPVSKKTFQPRL